MNYPKPTIFESSPAKTPDYFLVPQYGKVKIKIRHPKQRKREREVFSSFGAQPVISPRALHRAFTAEGFTGADSPPIYSDETITLNLQNNADHQMLVPLLNPQAIRQPNNEIPSGITVTCQEMPYSEFLKTVQNKYIGLLRFVTDRPEYLPMFTTYSFDEKTEITTSKPFCLKRNAFAFRMDVHEMPMRGMMLGKGSSILVAVPPKGKLEMTLFFER